MSRAKHGTRYGSQGIASSLLLDVVLVAYLAEFVSMTFSIRKVFWEQSGKERGGKEQGGKD